MGRDLRRAIARCKSDLTIAVTQHGPRPVNQSAVSVTRRFLEVSSRDDGSWLFNFGIQEAESHGFVMDFPALNSLLT